MEHQKSLIDCDEAFMLLAVKNFNEVIGNLPYDLGVLK